MVRCMKSGKLVEVGTHQELMAQRGEYCSLYGIQASAFTDVPATKGEDGVEGCGAAVVGV